MKTLVLLALVGLGAQLVDGSLGMAYGVTSTTLLLAIGTNPAAASATVHFAEIGTTPDVRPRALEVRQRRLEGRRQDRRPRRDRRLRRRHVLSSLSTEVAAPVMSLILLTLGVYILVRFTLRGIDRRNLGKPMRKRFLGPLGLVAGFVDATGGGGWGPVGTPAILASGRMEPRKVIGSIDTSEFLVAVAASLGFLLALGSQGVDFAWALVLLIGGLIAAPIAAWLVRHIPPRLLGSLVGGMIVLTNTRTLLQAATGSTPPTHARYADLRRDLRGLGRRGRASPSASTARTGRWSPPTPSRRSPRPRASAEADVVADLGRRWRPRSRPAGRAPRATDDTGPVRRAGSALGAWQLPRRGCRHRDQVT